MAIPRVPIQERVRAVVRQWATTTDRRTALSRVVRAVRPGKKTPPLRETWADRYLAAQPKQHMQLEYLDHVADLMATSSGQLVTAAQLVASSADQVEPQPAPHMLEVPEMPDRLLPELQIIVSAWPDLSNDVRAEIVGIAMRGRTAPDGAPGGLRGRGVQPAHLRKRA